VPTAEAPNVVWAIDFQYDSTTDGRPIKILSAVDEHTRECLGGLVERSITAERLANELDVIVADRGVAPRVLRLDNGPEMIDHIPQRLDISTETPHTRMGRQWAGYAAVNNSHEHLICPRRFEPWLCELRDRISGRPERFELCGADITEVAVTSFDVVEVVDVIGHRGGQLEGGGPFARVE
jgi:hypothetical protein